MLAAWWWGGLQKKRNFTTTMAVSRKLCDFRRVANQRW